MDVILRIFNCVVEFVFCVCVKNPICVKISDKINYPKQNIFFKCL